MQVLDVGQVVWVGGPAGGREQHTHVQRRDGDTWHVPQVLQHTRVILRDIVQIPRVSRERNL